MPTSALPPALAALREGRTWVEAWNYYRDACPDEDRATALNTLVAAMNVVLVAHEVALLGDALLSLGRLQRFALRADEVAEIGTASIREEEQPAGTATLVPVKKGKRTREPEGPDPLSMRIRAIADATKAGATCIAGESRLRDEIERRRRQLRDRAESVARMTGLERLAALAERAAEAGDYTAAANLWERAEPKQLTSVTGLAVSAQASARLDAELAVGNVPERM